MSDIRIVCTYDALKLAETLVRLLEAEQHRVRLTCGRQALHELDEASAADDAVLLIWSPNARSQTYMLRWAHTIPARRLIEIAWAIRDCPAVKRLAPPIDFTDWRGQRGARAWKALAERFDEIAGPVRPRMPAKTYVTLGLAGVAAASGAILLQQEAIKELPLTFPREDPAYHSDSGMGGPLTAREPASIGDDELRVRSFGEIPELAVLEPLAPAPDYELMDLRDRTLLERLNAYNPLRRDDPEEDD